MTSKLFEPLAFRNGVRAPNRLVLAPMTNVQSHDDGTLSEDELFWLERRARGGFGAVETCAAYVADDGKAWAGELGIARDEHMRGLRALAKAIGEHGAVGLVQLFHGGVRAPSKVTGTKPFSASVFDEDSPTFERPREATEADIARTVLAFRNAAVRAHAAGFAGVELHGAHGYLLSQFLSRSMNTRNDAWGGAPLENRARLLRETTRAVRAAVPPRFVVGVRLSPEDFGFARGLDLDESLEVARWLADDGIDFLHVSLWNAFERTKKRPEEHAIPLFRAALPEAVPLVVAGSVWTREEAESLVALGADGVAIGRAAIVNPDWPNAARDPAWAPTRPPLSVAEFGERAVSPRFVQYLRRWKGFVRDEDA
jgi:2,4-dienoyl-CoA reductase-like NADH-dependent reductase (Old Yellow Enzyme family)